MHFFLLVVRYGNSSTGPKPPDFCVIYIYNIFTVPELATSLEMSKEDFTNKFGVNKPEKVDKLASHCMMGGRAGKAAEALKDMGFVNAISYSGSFKDWKAKGGQIEGGGTS